MSDTATHQSRFDQIHRLLPCVRGKPKLIFDRTPGGHAQYHSGSHNIILDLDSMPDASRLNPNLSNDEFWSICLTHEYAHAYIPFSPRECIEYQEQCPAYIRMEQDIDKLTDVILLAIAGEPFFPSRDRIKPLLALWHGLRSQHYLEVSTRWAAKMRREFPPFPPPPPPKRKSTRRTPKDKV